MVSLLGMNTMRIDAKAYGVLCAADERELADAARRVTLDRLRYYILGKGANVLFTQDFPGFIIHPTGNGITTLHEDAKSLTLRVEAGVEWDDLVQCTVARGLWGLERLSGIPGSVGASPVQNIGAYGAEVSDVLVGVDVMEVATQQCSSPSYETLQMGYRDSIFKRDWRQTHAIYAVTLRLRKCLEAPFSTQRLGLEEGESYEESPQWVRERVLAVRRSKLPEVDAIGSAGSFFKNAEIAREDLPLLEARFPGIPTYPSQEGRVKVSSGWLIERCGWKGYREGAVGVYPKQALVLVNYGGGTGRDIARLCAKITDDVYRKSGLRLEPEVNMI